jgi:hypothetical protein
MEPKLNFQKLAQAVVAMTAAAVAVPLVAAVAALVAIAVVTVLNHAARLALKATAAVIASRAMVIVLKIAAHLHPALKVVLKVAVISAPKAASSHAVISAVNNAASHLAVVKVALSPVATSAQTTVAVTALIHVTAVHHAHRVVVTMPAAAQAIAFTPWPQSHRGRQLQTPQCWRSRSTQAHGR